MDMDTLWTLGLLGPLAMLMYVGWLVPLGVSVAPQGAQPGIGCTQGRRPTRAFEWGGPQHGPKGLGGGPSWG